MSQNAKFYRVKCGEWRYPGKNLSQLGKYEITKK